MARIGKKEAARILRRVVAKHGPDTVYGVTRDKGHWEKLWSCRYVNRSDKPMCIVGVALVEEMGVDPKLLKKNASIRTRWLESPELKALLTPGAVDVFATAQRSQDRQYPWGEAVEAATAGIR